jgi:UDPglucose 6-dehydrogenase
VVNIKGREEMTLGHTQVRPVLVVGCGFVGETVAKSLESDGRAVIRIDPALNDNKISHFKDDAGAAVVAVPTPTLDGRCDDSAIRQVLGELGNIPVLLKCTVPPNMLETYGENVTYNPEFLRAKTAQEDFLAQKHFILGGTELGCLYWKRVFSYLDAEFIETDRITASMVKYTHNCWLATKVAFFHELMNNVGDKYNHEDMISILGKFENIGPSHMSAPNDDGGLGFGGHCFPKDTEAFLDFTESEILKQVIDTNTKLGYTK